MGQKFSYVYPSQWITEGSIWRPPDVITLRDEAGAIIGSTTMTTMVMTLYNPSSTTYSVIGGIELVDVKNQRSCTLSTQGIFVLTLLPVDTVIIDTTQAYELRTALVEYTWASGAKADALEVTVVIRNLIRRPYVAPPP